MLGLSFEKLILIIVVAALIVGPQRLPLYAEKLAQLVRAIRDLTDTAKARATAELGLEFDPSDWKKIDPRQYDPRRIIQETLASSPTSEVSQVHIEEVRVVDQPPTTPTAPIAKGGWQETLLARVGTSIPDPAAQDETTDVPTSDQLQ